jgi:hypothetical protein
MRPVLLVYFTPLEMDLSRAFPGGRFRIREANPQARFFFFLR